MTVDLSVRYTGCVEKTNGEEKLRKVWHQMHRRCSNPKDGKYPRYGGRGIKVCPEWGDYSVFRSWALAAGYAQGLSINRIDNDGGYNPRNCEWADQITQANNKSNSRWLTAFGETMTVTQWSRDPRCVVDHGALVLRIFRRRWDVERALTTPILRSPASTHCPQNHEYTPENIAWEGPNKDHRRCRMCMRARALENYRKRKASLAVSGQS
jgi:hypothetical protein